ncbi:hypothetical protein SNEBB_004498 [Seison nebaliae]|nr:hypothetical protein SNEBB_004498 [Seison nebaliae]
MSFLNVLGFERDTFELILKDNCLFVSAKGIGTGRIIYSLLKLYANSYNLVFALDFPQIDIDWYGDSLKKDENFRIEKLKDKEEVRYHDCLFHVINSNISIKDRIDIYKLGGLIFISSRILVVDILLERLDLKRTNGFLVNNAEKCQMMNDQTSFILHLYREKNEKGFIRSFASNPLQLTKPYSMLKLEMIMNKLNISALILLPRFHCDVQKELNDLNIDLIEVKVEYSSVSDEINISLLAIITWCFTQLKKSTDTLDLSDITLDMIQNRNLLSIKWIEDRDELNSCLNDRSKTLIREIEELKELLELFLYFDPINFDQSLAITRSTQDNISRNSGWLFLDATDQLFSCSKRRIFTKEFVEKFISKDKIRNSAALESILRDLVDGTKKFLGKNVLILVKEKRMIQYLSHLIQYGSEMTIKELYNSIYGDRYGFCETETCTIRMNEEYDGELTQNHGVSDNYRKRINLMKHFAYRFSCMNGENVPQKLMKMNNDDKEMIMTNETINIFFDTHIDWWKLELCLETIKPEIIILYDLELRHLRQMEVYCYRTNIPITIYTIQHSFSTDEQRYLSSLKNENDSFEILIKEKSIIVPHQKTYGRVEENIYHSNPITSSTLQTELEKNSSMNVRQTAVIKSSIDYMKRNETKILIDIREFRADLPSFLYHRGLKIIPITLEIGDYILTKNLCCERKSISDLISSLVKGRLYNQLISMNRFYKSSILLIEFFSQNGLMKSIKLLFGRRTTKFSLNDTIVRFILMFIQFPHFHVVWSASSNQTAELFAELKFGQTEPDEENVKKLTDEEEVKTKYHSDVMDILASLPGIDTTNIHNVMRKCFNLNSLISLSLNELCTITFSTIKGKELYNFFNFKK